MQSINPRLRAAKILQQVIQEKKSLQECFVPEDTPFIYQLSYGMLRHYYTLRAMANLALQKPLSIKDQDIYLLILLGLYQIQHLDIAEYAIVKETVEAADMLKKSWAKKLINAILRRFLREREDFEKQCLLSKEAEYAHPQWFIDKVKIAYPNQWQAILKANNEKASMHLRVNLLKISRDAYLDILNETPLPPSGHPLPQGGREKQGDFGHPQGEKEIDGGFGQPQKIKGTTLIKLAHPVDVHKLPGFSEGWVSVQDAASQQVIQYLDLQPNQRILDACAAPGGKTCHILETEPNISELIALDISAERLKKITENLKRLDLPSNSGKASISLLVGDASSPAHWWDKKLFDRILLDAPCSATGVIRRHPDIKLLRTAKEIQSAVDKQKVILENLWQLLKSNGLLIYTTCSVLPEENENQIMQFTKNNPNAELQFISQLLPSEEHDGFFYSVLKKN